MKTSGEGFDAHCDLAGFLALQRGGYTVGDVARVFRVHTRAGEFLYAHTQPVTAHFVGHAGATGDNTAGL